MVRLHVILILLLQLSVLLLIISWNLERNDAAPRSNQRGVQLIMGVYGKVLYLCFVQICALMPDDGSSSRNM